MAHLRWGHGRYTWPDSTSMDPHVWISWNPHTIIFPRGHPFFIFFPRKIEKKIKSKKHDGGKRRTAGKFTYWEEIQTCGAINHGIGVAAIDLSFLWPALASVFCLLFFGSNMETFLVRSFDFPRFVNNSDKYFDSTESYGPPPLQYH